MHHSLPVMYSYRCLHRTTIKIILFIYSNIHLSHTLNTLAKANIISSFIQQTFTYHVQKMPIKNKKPVLVELKN